MLITRLSVPEIIKAKSYADSYTKKLYTVTSDVPIVRMGFAFSAMGYVLERIVQRFEETAFTSKEAIHDILHFVLKDKLDKADINKVVDNLLEERKPLVEARADIDFLVQGVTHELNMIQISRSGGYKLVDRVEGGVQVDQDILKRAKMCEQKMKAEEKKTSTKPKANCGGGGGGRGGRGERGRGRGYGPGGVRMCFKCEQPSQYSHSCPKNAPS